MGNIKERKEQLQPNRAKVARSVLTELGYVCTGDDTELRFEFNGSTVRYYPYTGWHTGKTINDGRGFSNLLRQITEVANIMPQKGKKPYEVKIQRFTMHEDTEVIPMPKGSIAIDVTIDSHVCIIAECPTDVEEMEDKVFCMKCHSEKFVKTNNMSYIGRVVTDVIPMYIYEIK